MTLLFDRKIELHVFLDAEKYVIRDLHMSFDILATRDSKPNTASLVVYNLSQTTRNLFTKSTTGVEVWAGYGEDLGMIFRGSWDEDTSFFRHYLEGASWVTEIETGDGLKEFQTTYFDRAYSQGTEVTSIIQDVANAMGLPSSFDFESLGSINSAAVFSNKAKDVLDNLSFEYGFDWSIQHGAIEVVVSGTPPTNDATAVLLSPDTGLVGRPVITKDGLEVNTLMLATIKPTRLIQLDPASVDTALGSRQDVIKSKIVPSATGVYIVDRIRYHGDNMGGSFNCVIESDLQ